MKTVLWLDDYRNPHDKSVKSGFFYTWIEMYSPFKEEKVDVVIRPEDIDIVDVKDGKMTGEVLSTLFKGVHYEIIVMVEGREYIVHSTQSAEVGAEVGMTVAPEDIHVMEVGV